MQRASLGEDARYREAAADAPALEEVSPARSAGAALARDRGSSCPDSSPRSLSPYDSRSQVWKGARRPGAPHALPFLEGADGAQSIDRLLRCATAKFAEHSLLPAKVFGP